MPANQDPRVVSDFGLEWKAYDQSALNSEDLHRIFNDYFRLFPWRRLGPDSVGFDLGCGSGRWAKLVALKVGHLHAIDASADALEVARKNLSRIPNCTLHLASVDAIPLPDESMDFGYSLGVLHHVPETGRGIEACVRKLKRGAPFLLYLYYALENRPWWFRALWRLSDRIRQAISRRPPSCKFLVCDIIALSIYYPISRALTILEWCGFKVDHLPLSSYRKASIYTMRTDALDRFGTRLEKRFTQKQIRDMMEAAGLDQVEFGSPPYWMALGLRR
jgi:ubiquinone/menaquinone biosynthesis C-methylase UbiE